MDLHHLGEVNSHLIHVLSQEVSWIFLEFSFLFGL